jgi:hypothetical protein
MDAVELKLVWRPPGPAKAGSAPHERLTLLSVTGDFPRLMGLASRLAGGLQVPLLHYATAERWRAERRAARLRRFGRPRGAV